VAMAKMFERVKNENNEYQQEFLPKLSDAIVYSTIKAKNNSDGLVEKIINVTRLLASIRNALALVYWRMTEKVTIEEKI
jgi:hypothetical protein